MGSLIFCVVTAQDEQTRQKINLILDFYSDVIIQRFGGDHAWSCIFPGLLCPTEIRCFSCGSSESHLWISGSICSKLWIWHFGVWRCHGAPCCCSLEKHNCLCLAVLFPFTQMATLSLLKINIMRNSLAPFHLLDTVSPSELQWKLYEFSSSQLAVLWLSRWPSCYCPTGSNCAWLWCQGMDLVSLGTRGS